MQLREVQISICQIVAEIEVEAEQETKESVNKLLKKEQRDYCNVGIDTQPGVEMRHHKNVNQGFLNLDRKIQQRGEFSYYPVDSGENTWFQFTNVQFINLSLCLLDSKHTRSQTTPKVTSRLQAHPNNALHYPSIYNILYDAVSILGSRLDNVRAKQVCYLISTFIGPP